MGYTPEYSAVNYDSITKSAYCYEMTWKVQQELNVTRFQGYHISLHADCQILGFWYSVGEGCSLEDEGKIPGGRN